MTDTATVCQPGHTKTVRHTSGKLQATIYREYGIDRASGHFASTTSSPRTRWRRCRAETLWPETYGTMPWNAHVKDKLDRLHALVCAGRLRIEQAQHEIAADWIAAYEKYIGKP